MSLKQYLPRPYIKRRFYLPDEIQQHNTANDCFVCIFHKVYDISAFIQEHINCKIIKLAHFVQLLIKYAGQDISFWFDQETQDYKSNMVDGIQKYTILEREGFNLTEQQIQRDWFQNDKFFIGHLTKKVRRIKIINTLTKHSDVASEENILEILDRYLPFNIHANSYTWKRLKKNLDMSKTLDQNGIADETSEFEILDIPFEQQYIPAIHLYFNDDLSIA